jgi:hypothetical protein
MSAIPFAPVGGRNVDSLVGFRTDPSTDNATARKHKGVWPATFDDGQLKLDVKRRSRYGFPHSLLIQCATSPTFDLDHKARPAERGAMSALSY